MNSTPTKTDTLNHNSRTLYVLRKGGRYVNVDLTTVEGMKRANKMNLIASDEADLIAVPDVWLGSSLLLNDAADTHLPHRGVLFAMFRHPVERTASWFYHKRNVPNTVHYDPALEIYELTDWVNGPNFASDYSTRMLCGKRDARVPLTSDDLDAAKETLRRKCVVGLLDEKGESMRRFERFFGWDGTGVEKVVANDAEVAILKDGECEDRLLHWNWVNKHNHPQLEEGSEAYRVVESKNIYDMELYMYARQLFEEQTVQLGFDEDEIYGVLERAATNR